MKKLIQASFATGFFTIYLAAFVPSGAVQIKPKELWALKADPNQMALIISADTTNVQLYTVHGFEIDTPQNFLASYLPPPSVSAPTSGTYWTSPQGQKVYIGHVMPSEIAYLNLLGPYTISRIQFLATYNFIQDI